MLRNTTHARPDNVNRCEWGERVRGQVGTSPRREEFSCLRESICCLRRLCVEAQRLSFPLTSSCRESSCCFNAWQGGQAQIQGEFNLFQDFTDSRFWVSYFVGKHTVILRKIIPKKEVKSLYCAVELTVNPVMWQECKTGTSLRILYELLATKQYCNSDLYQYLVAIL